MKRIINFCIYIVLIFNFVFGATVFSTSLPDDILPKTLGYITQTVKNPQISDVGGDWSVIGLARSGADANIFFTDYLKNAEKQLKTCDGVLNDKKYTDYSRVILALTSIGKNPENFAGYNLLKPLGDYEKTVWQGINGAIWALIALDSKNYDIPENADAKIQATREMYVNHILENTLSCGGWALDNNAPEPDPEITGMALAALAKYKDTPEVSEKISAALDAVSMVQTEDGGFLSYGIESAESCAQMLVALCELGIDYSDPRFVKNGKTLVDNLMMFYNAENGGFCHTQDADFSDLMTSEQCLYALVSIQRYFGEKNSLYRMSDAESIVQITENNSDNTINVPDVIFPNKTFSDISSHENKTAIEALASRGIINGIPGGMFDPDASITRAEFAAILIRGLGVSAKQTAPFTDVLEKDWFYNDVNTAYSYGIVNGVSASEFAPNVLISREEAAVMIARAASFCGLSSDMTVFAARNVLAGFTDYVRISEWALLPMAFCVNEKIISDDLIELNPQTPALRAEIAQMLFNMLVCAELI